MCVPGCPRKSVFKKLGEPGREQIENSQQKLKPAKSVLERARGFKSPPRRQFKCKYSRRD